MTVRSQSPHEFFCCNEEANDETEQPPQGDEVAFRCELSVVNPKRTHERQGQYCADYGSAISHR